MKHYVIGFVYNRHRTLVALVEKKSPEWQEGALNGIGGKIEIGETPLEAMKREGLEECGKDLDWQEFAEVTGRGFVMHCFSYVAEEGLQWLPEQNDVGEVYSIKGVISIVGQTYEQIDNLHWMVPMGLYPPDKPYVIIQNADSYVIEKS